MSNTLSFTVYFGDGKKVHLYSRIDPVVAAVSPDPAFDAALQALREWLATPEARDEILARTV